MSGTDTGIRRAGDSDVPLTKVQHKKRMMPVKREWRRHAPEENKSICLTIERKGHLLMLQMYILKTGWP